jgi:hypothetical protein
MKNLLKKIQQKIYAIFHALKAYASKLRISSFVGGQFKKIRYKIWLLMTNNKFDITKDGDSLERNKITFIDTYIPNYRYLWSKFIGHDGLGNIQECNLNDLKDKKRRDIGSLNYSIMQNLITLLKKKEKIIKFQYDQTNIDSYTELKELITEYIVLFGLIVDRQEKMLNHFVVTDNLNNYTKLSELYKPTRNFLQHDNDVTIIVDELGLIAIPVINNITKPDDVNWFKEFENGEYIYLETYVTESFNDLVKELNSNINKIKCFMEEYWVEFSFNEKNGLFDEYAKSGTTKTIIYNPRTFKK